MFFFEMGWEAEALASSRSSAAPTHSPSKKNDEASLAALAFTLSVSQSAGAKRSSLLDDLDTLGSAPLPPYIHRPAGAADARDAVDYQTVFAGARARSRRRPRASTSPRELLAAVAARGIEIARVTLHVGLGTFKPVKVDRVEEHRMDPERARSRRTPPRP